VNKYLIVIGTAVLLLVVGLSGCTYVPTSTTQPVNINTFISIKEGELIRFYFLLEDKDGINTCSDGQVELEIFDEDDMSLYNQEFDVKTSEFVDYGFKLTGTDIGKAYEWRVTFSDIKKGNSTLGFGKAILTFTTPKNKSLHAEYNLVEIPIYTEEEIEDIEKEDYNDTAVSVNKKISKGNFEVTVTRAGFFNDTEWGLTNEYFRVDMEVKNIGSESDYFFPSGLAIIDSQNNQYDYTYGGTLDIFSTIHAGVTKKGYLLFECVPATETSVRFLLELGYDANFNLYFFEFNIKLK